MPVTLMASVEEAEAYAAQHAIAARLEAALNACLAAQPATPFTFIASHLRDGAGGAPAARPPAQEGAAPAAPLGTADRRPSLLMLPRRLAAAVDEEATALCSAQARCLWSY